MRQGLADKFHRQDLQDKKILLIPFSIQLILSYKIK